MSKRKAFFATLLSDVIKGIIIGLLYLEFTRTNDTSFKNTLLFVFFYVVMVNCAAISGIDPNVVTNAFITKTIFTLVDERIKKKDE